MPGGENLAAWFVRKRQRRMAFPLPQSTGNATRRGRSGENRNARHLSMSQKTQPIPRPGDLVRLRHGDWRVVGVTAYADCAVLHLDGIGAGTVGRQRIVLHPFDRAVPLARHGRPRLVTRGTWLQAARVLAVSAGMRDTLRAAVNARFDLLPYQFEPALALLRGLATRVLIADAVGLGKTIQAGLALAELRARERSARALVVAPAGLRDQWARELNDRFAIPAVLLDAPALARTVASLPAGVNPWEADPVIITSLDFIKQPEISRALDDTIWDLVIVDEAHMAATARERHLAIDGLSSRARWVVLLTATPHAGDEASFQSLCRLGQLDDDGPILMFRRTAGDVGMPRERHVHLLRVALTPAEMSLHAGLDRYSRLVWDETTGDRTGDARLAMVVLRKRALSGVSAVMRSIAHRLERLDGGKAPVGAQLLLPLADDSEGESDADDLVPAAALSCPGLSDLDTERRLLAGILEAAMIATAHDSKIAALLKLLRRIGEPAIVFTEYRDTALAVAAALVSLGSIVVLHGGLDRRSRREVERRFLDGGARILVATDAAGQGLNLQAACRLVVNLELPWNPIRLEQRIGRVDRIGQVRRVHAVNLVAAGTAEEAILGRLSARMAKVRDAIGYESDPIGAASRIAAAMIAPDPSISDSVDGLYAMMSPRPCPPARSLATALPPPGLASLALSELERLRHARSVLWPRAGSINGHAFDLRASLETTAPWGLIVSRMDSLARGVLCLFRIHVIDARGSLVEEMLVPVHAETGPLLFEPGTTGGHLGTLTDVNGAILPALGERARLTALARLAALAPDVATGSRRSRRREGAIAALLKEQFLPGVTAPVQAGLFDQRGLRQAAARRLAWTHLQQVLEQRRAGHQGAEALTLAGKPEPMLVLWIRPAS